MKSPTLLVLLSSLAAAQAPTPTAPPLVSASSGDPLIRRCHGAASCGEGEVCRGGRCRRACSRDGDCGEESWCSFQALPNQPAAAGICHERGAGSECLGDADCGPGFACTGRSAMEAARLCASTAPPRQAPPPRTTDLGSEPDAPQESARLAGAWREARGLAGERWRATGKPVPAGFHVVERWGGGIPLGLGLMFFAVSYLGSVLVWTTQPNNGPAQLVPVVGPFFTGGAGGPTWSASLTALAFVASSSQLLGIALSISSGRIFSKWVERVPRLLVVPTAAGSAAGASVVGTF